MNFEDENCLDENVQCSLSVFESGKFRSLTFKTVHREHCILLPFFAMGFRLVLIETLKQRLVSLHTHQMMTGLEF